MAGRSWSLLRPRPAFHLLHRHWLRSPAVFDRHDDAQVLHNSPLRRPLWQQLDNPTMVGLSPRLCRPRPRRLPRVQGEISRSCPKEKV